MINKQPTTRIGGYQLWRTVDYRTNKVRLEPGEQHVDFFDLGAFFPDDVIPGQSPWDQVTIPADFRPLLCLHDNYGNQYYCDESGLHEGQWPHPHLDAVRRTTGASFGVGPGLLSKRRWLPWLGWKRGRTRGLGEAPELTLPDV